MCIYNLKHKYVAAKACKVYSSNKYKTYTQIQTDYLFALKFFTIEICVVNILIMSNLTVIHYFQMILIVNAGVITHISVTVQVDHIMIILNTVSFY